VTLFASIVRVLGSFFDEEARMTITAQELFFGCFDDVEDPRIERSRQHQLFDIIVIAICAIIAGSDGWSDIELYGNAKHDWLKTFLSLPNGIPSHDTFGRVFAHLDPDQFRAGFLRVVQKLADILPGECIAFDGKKLKSSFNTDMDTNPIHMLSAWASSAHLVLAQMKVDEKTNEITALPQLLSMLDIEGCKVTIDAMGCQTAIAEQIDDQQGTYILAVKGNQPTLLDDITTTFDELLNGKEDTTFDFYQTIEEGHGRHETRRYYTTQDIDHLRTRENWKQLTTIMLVESEREEGGKQSRERRYYISNGSDTARALGSAVRLHWGIENKVHWVLDVTFHEDNIRIKSGNAPENIAIIRHLILNLLREEKTWKGSLAAKRKRAGWDDEYMMRVLKCAS
jgi:predicted transposase YbfD/YdcC